MASASLYTIEEENSQEEDANDSLPPTNNNSINNNNDDDNNNNNNDNNNDSNNDNNNDNNKTNNNIITSSPKSSSEPLTYEGFRQLRASSNIPYALTVFFLLILHAPMIAIPFLVLGCGMPFLNASPVPDALHWTAGMKLTTFILLLCVTNANLYFWNEGLKELGLLGRVKTWVPDMEGEMVEEVERITGGKERVRCLYWTYVVSMVLLDAVVALGFGRFVGWVYG